MSTATEAWDSSVVTAEDNWNNTEDVGMLSHTDEATRKLQYSLDELIEQTATTAPKPHRIIRNKRNKNHSFNSLQNSGNNKTHQSYKQILRNKKFNHIGVNRLPNAPYQLPLPYLYNPLIHPSLLMHPPASFLLNKNTALNRDTANVELALAEIEIFYPPMVPSPENASELVPSTTESLVVRFKKTDVIKVLKQRGELILNSGGWKTISTRFVINTALKPLGLWIELCNKENTNSQNKKPMKVSEADWTVIDGVSFLAAFSDDMVIGQIGTQTLSQLLARASVIAQHLKQMKNNALAKCH